MGLPQKKWIFVIVLSTLVACLSYLTSRFSNKLNILHERNKSVIYTVSPSSVWCHPGPSGERLCKFRNICYDPQFQEFQFLLTEKSVLSGVERPEQWMNIDLSTVLGHNAFKMKVSLLSPENHIDRKTVFIKHIPTFIIHRFKPDNIMHVLHDDLIPLYFTIDSIFEMTEIKNKQFSLAFTDDYEESIIDDWYHHFSGTTITRLAFAKETVCFDTAYVGLHKATLWFNYGFKQLQGVYFNENFNMNGVRNFVDYSLNVWQTKPKSVFKFSFRCTKVVILVRSQTRKILNLEVLIEAIKAAHEEAFPYQELEIIEVDLAVHDTSSILSHVRQAKLIVGMHGAGMILSIFLPPSSAVVELFPFGINPDNVSFLKALLQQEQSYPLYYESWRNEDRSNSIPGSLNDTLAGMISHLPMSVQKQIKNLSEVPAVKCCHDPAYLYYINHDTFVNKKVFLPIFKAFKKTQVSKPEKNSALLKHIFPALPSFIACSICGKTAVVEWGESSNSLENEGLWFQITVLHGEQIMIVNVTDSSSKVYSVELNKTADVTQVWLQPFNKKNVAGHVRHKNCVLVK